MASIYLDTESENQDNVVNFCNYKPWSHHTAYGGTSMNYPRESGRLLDLKDMKPCGIDFFFDMLNAALGSDFVITSVPSHDPANTVNGIRLLAIKLASESGRIDGTGCLVRHTKIDKLAGGGSRSIQVHTDSIGVHQPGLLKGKKVLVLDDVTTTNNSLTACKMLIEQCGPALVRRAAIGLTTHD